MTPTDLLKNKLMNSTEDNILYVDYNCFVLVTNNLFEFYRNPSQLLGTLEKNIVPELVVEYLEKFCPKFVNCYRNGEYNEKDGSKLTNIHHSKLPIPQKHGNVYSEGNAKMGTIKCYPNKRYLYCYEDRLGGGTANIQTIGEFNIHLFLRFSIFPEMAEQINSIYELDCFRYKRFKETKNGYKELN